LCNPSLQGDQGLDVAALKQGFVKLDAGEPAGLRGRAIGAVGRALNDESPSLRARGGGGWRLPAARSGPLQAIEELGKLCTPHESPRPTRPVRLRSVACQG